MAALYNAAHNGSLRPSPAKSWGRSGFVKSTLVVLSLLMSLTLTSALEVDIEAEISTGAGTTMLEVSTPALPPRVHEVAVGAAGEQRFTPRYINANIGDFVRFSFKSGNHTVTESTFENPCSPRGAFDTNFFHDATQPRGTNDMTLLVDSTNPRWFFCRQVTNVSHCQSGMIFAINPGPFWYDFVAHARNESRVRTNSTTIGSSGRRSPLPHAVSGYRTSDAAGSVSLFPSATITVNSTSALTAATVTSALKHHATWSTSTLTTMITTTFSVPRRQTQR